MIFIINLSKYMQYINNLIYFSKNYNKIENIII